ncbi:MAG: AAA family ATPase [Bacilli bacterium]|nr:AAA family ATPase [Bacilli bacterium]
MKKVVLITGDLAAGKSTLADNLSKTLNFTCIKKDCVKEIICDSVGFSTREENKRISVAAVNSMIHFLEQTLKIGGEVILEANFRLEEILRIQDIVKQYNGELFIIYLTGDPKVLYERFLSRVPTRHRAHLSIGLDKDYNKFVEYINDLRNQLERIDCLKIDTTSLLEEDVIDKAFSYINSK